MHERHVILATHGASRAVAMDSITHANDEHGPDDVLIGASFMGIVAVQFAARFRPRAVIAHAAGIGRDGAGINGLWFLEGRGIPAAAVGGDTAPIADGVGIWERGRIAVVNHWARALGVAPGLDVPAAVERFFAWDGSPWDDSLPRERREVVHEDARGAIVACDSIRFAIPADAANVVCVGSHGGATAAAYALEIRPRGFISSDAGRAVDDSGVDGLLTLQAEGIPGAAVDVATARIGEGRSTYEDGVVSVVNLPAADLGVEVGQPARRAASLMLGAR